MDSKNLMKALAAFNSENINVKKSKMVDMTLNNGRRVKYSYTPLEDILQISRPILSKHGLVSWFEIREQKIYCFLAHYESGEFIFSDIELPSGLKPQDLGSHITYMKRYLLSAMLSISTDEDDDATVVQYKGEEKPAKPVKPAIERKLLKNEFKLKELGVTIEEAVKDVDGRKYLAGIYINGLNGVYPDFSKEIKEKLGL